MPADPPIACSLSAAEIPARLAEMSDVGRGALLDVDVSGATAILRFRADAATRGRLQAIVAAESHCCAFLEMNLSDGPQAIALAITAPAGAESVRDDLVAAFGGRVGCR
jgi:hypothetical protein